MNKYLMLLLMTMMLIGLTVVSADDVTTETSIPTSTVETHSTHDNSVYASANNDIQQKQVSTDTKNHLESYDNIDTKSVNSSQKQGYNTIQKAQTKNNIKSASASEEIRTIESNTKTKLENAFVLAKTEIDNAQSTYEKEQVPTSVIELVNEILNDAQRAETLYAENGDVTLTQSMNNIRNYVGYADFLINPEKITDPVLAERYKTRPLDKINGTDTLRLFTLVAQKENETNDTVYINLTSDEFQNLYNEVGEIHHPGEYDRYSQVGSVSIKFFVDIIDDPRDFTQIPFPLARAYLENAYYRNLPYTQTIAGCSNGTGWYHVFGSTLTKSVFPHNDTGELVEGNAGIVFWKMIKTDDENKKYILTNERYYPDIYGHPPSNMPRENDDDNGIYFVGYVIKNELGSIHIDGVVVEYRVPDSDENVNFTIKKVWNDSNNQDGLRPETITVQLLADGEVFGDNIVLYESNGWTYDYINLPKVNAKGEEIKYTINELTKLEDYTVSYDDYTIVNTHIPETTQLEVVKVWVDDNNRDKLRPNEVTVSLYKNGVVNRTVKLNDGNNWRYYFNNMPVYSNGVKINYTVTELSIPGYSTAVSRKGNEFIIQNTHKIKTRNVTVNKVWNDSGNQDGLRPGSIRVQLLADGSPYGSPVSLTAAGGWKHTFTDLPVNAGGSPIVYTIIETGIPNGYTADNNGLTIINTHIPETTQLEVVKVWVDDNNRDKLRPNEVTVSLYKNGVVNRTVKLNDGNNWRYYFNNMPVYSNGVKINYTVTELSIPGYSTAVSRKGNEFIIQNTHKIKTRNVTVNKVWNDSGNQDGLRPGSIRVQLLADGSPYGSPVSLTAAGGWKHTFTDLPVNAGGSPIVYTIIETGIPNGYTALNNGLTITNTHIPETTQLEVVKEWEDNHNADGLRPNSIGVNLLSDGDVLQQVTLNSVTGWRYKFQNLPVYKNGHKITYTVEEKTVANYDTTITQVNGEYIIKNVHTPAVKDLTVKKVWQDNENEHMIRPDSIMVQLFADGEKYGNTIEISSENGWTYVFTDLQVNYNGKETQYFVEEVGVPENYTKTVEVTNKTEIVITNTYDPEHVQVDVIKGWDDGHDTDKIRPDSVQVQLYANGEKQGNPVTLNQDNYWRYSFTNLPKHINGVEIEYAIEEVTQTKGYTSNIVTVMKNEFEIINTHVPEKINITVNKKWDDNDNQDGLRPENVQIALLADGEEYAVVTLSSQKGWSYTFTNLTKNFNGEPIKYTVVELGIPEGYISSSNGYTITNTHVPETVDLHIVKEWLDNYNQDGLRPESVSAALYADGALLQTVTLGVDNNWTFVVGGLPRFDAGKEISYRVVEEDVSGYTSSVTDNNNKIVIVNVHAPETRDITLSKFWVDDDNRDGLRPGSIRVQVLADGVEYQVVTLSEDNGWTYTISGVAKYAEGKEINYSTFEIGIPSGYTVVNNGFTITNTHVPETIEVNVIVEWDDFDDLDEIRPENVTIILYKDGEEVERIIVNPDDDWRKIFDDLPKYENGTLINYTADEILPNGYTRTIEVSGNEIIITNIHRPKLINITVTKTWDDNDNQDALRPESITVELLANNQHYATVTLSQKDNWEYQFINLPKTKKGVDISYVIKELDNVESYTTSIDGYAITNKHVPETTDLKVIVEWDDLDNQDGIRPENVTIIIYANNKIVENRTVSSDEDWTTLFDKLPKYENGTLINYTADEILPNGYTKTIDIKDNEVIITNVHRPESRNISVIINWDDLDNLDGSRPNNVTVILYADGKVIKNITVTSDNWNTVFEDLPKYDNGKLINYTVDEVLPNGYTRTIEITEDGFIITNIHRPVTKLIWTWKLINMTPQDNPQDNTQNNPVSDKTTYKGPKVIKTVKKQVKWDKFNSRSSYRRYRGYNYRRYRGYNYRRYRNYNYRYSGARYYRPAYGLTKHAYRLYIQLYNEYLAGNISYADFVVLLEKEGVDPTVVNFDDNGEIIMDYEDIDDVPEQITVKHKEDKIPASSDNIDVSNPSKQESPVVDSGNVEVESGVEE